MPAAAIVPTAKYSLLMKDIPTRVLNGAILNGVGAIFTVQENKDSNLTNAVFYVSGTFTVCTVSLLSSEDGGATFNPHSTADTAIDANASKVLILKDLLPGLCYQWKVASLTGTSVTLDGLAA